MSRLRKVGSGLICATIVALTMTAFGTPLSASSGSFSPSPSTVCRLLSVALQYANALPSGSLKDAVISEINEEMVEHGC